MMKRLIRANAACVRPFHAIRDVEFSPDNILTSASFPRRIRVPLLQWISDRMIERLMKEKS